MYPVLARWHDGSRLIAWFVHVEAARDCAFDAIARENARRENVLLYIIVGHDGDSFTYLANHCADRYDG